MRVITLASCAHGRKQMIAKMLSIGYHLADHIQLYNSDSLGTESTVCYKWGGRTAQVIIREIDFTESMRATISLTAQDIVYDVKTRYANSFDASWLTSFASTPATLWAEERTSGSRIKTASSYLDGIWRVHLDQMFGIVSPIIMAVSLFQHVGPEEVRPVVKRVHQPAHDTPWPLPEMTIMVPRGVIVESMCYDAGAGAIKIVFG